MNQFSDDKRPHYDDEGNIILPEAEATGPVWETTEYDSPPPPQPEAPSVDNLTIEQVKRQGSRVHRQAGTRSPTPRFNLVAGLKKFFKISLNEGKQQLGTSTKDCGEQIKGLGSDCKSGWQALKQKLFQPVWVVNRKHQTKKQSNRATLFVMDTLRFGTTFAVLFGLLFVGLNYQSFWKIVSSNLQPLHISSTSDAGSSISAVRRQLVGNSRLATGEAQLDPLQFLPAVGPPDNRIVIPKLSLNVPIQTPPPQALINEDWRQLEVDIQDSLRDGVVHYPGTAKPGQAGNFFITGHSSYYPTAIGDYKTVFATLHKLDVGDEYLVYHNGDMHRYVVRSKKEVKPSDVSVLDQPLDKRMSTLMTCTPVGTTLRRLVLLSEEIDPVTGAVLEVGEGQKRPEQKLAMETLPI